ncbi:hypothetical protein FUSPEROL_01825 [Fusobacterium periodonticum ATCC 33693]|uniref:Uncharacterized protein n=1 Tax=Fusobacterium periodonticum ATCC 33693 TaxID=546275 RepID=D4CWL7_9FUSO|nr:hypothetical protein FUSPEROL_01825 [Fusobacterium periodonticum ATCC 33693]
MQHFQCWCYSYPTSTCLTAKATSVLTHLIKFDFILATEEDIRKYKWEKYKLNIK